MVEDNIYCMHEMHLMFDHYFDLLAVLSTIIQQHSSKVNFCINLNVVDYDFKLLCNGFPLPPLFQVVI